ncbi:MAG: T9SS type A sorting domain-containing protein, partial [Gemmatimonadetes bacterium]|nr:T9SS type A sorting domain-containing protein [Gemmatimonadota bacterium]
STWQFTDVSVAAGASVPHALVNQNTPAKKMAGGVGCGDYDNDGWIDLYVLGGDAGTNQLLRNNGDGTFSDVAAAAGVDLTNELNMGAVFADWNGDGWLALFVGGVGGTQLRLFENDGDGTFTDVTALAGVFILTDTFSGSFGDPDRDGDLDLVIAHWQTSQGTGHFWRNEGNGPSSAQFISADTIFGYVNFPGGAADYTFAHNFVDLNSDGWADLVCASDFVTSHVFMNNGDGTLTETTDYAVITDDNGMGSTVADYDKDGDLDWFVTSIYDTASTEDGNRMYRNDGNGVFEDATDHANVRDGQWGWAATFQDFNNDGWLDIAHVNGWPNAPKWQDDPTRLFISNGDETFTEMTAALGADYSGDDGRGIAAFDYDRDGDIDIFMANKTQNSVLLRNDCPSGNSLTVKLKGPSPNTEQIGARITATVGASSQLWELRCGNNFNSQDPAEAHFGLGTATQVDVLLVEWTDGSTTTLNSVPGNQYLLIDQLAGVDAPAVSPDQDQAVRAFPNPFHDGTHIHFASERAQPVSVKIFDTGGRLVRVLKDGRAEAGPGSVRWDGRDEAGRRVAAGIYHYEVRTEGRRDRGKVVLVR